MSPERLHFVLTIALQQVKGSLRAAMAQQATRQLQACYPLAGCGVTLMDGQMIIISVGRN